MKCFNYTQKPNKMENNLMEKHKLLDVVGMCDSEITVCNALSVVVVLLICSLHIHAIFSYRASHPWERIHQLITILRSLAVSKWKRGNPRPVDLGPASRDSLPVECSLCVCVHRILISWCVLRKIELIEWPWKRQSERDSRSHMQTASDT